jgi:hypothetical protein
LAVQKKKLTTLEAEMLGCKHGVKESIFDVSRIENEILEIATDFIYRMADVQRGTYIDGSLVLDDYSEFDEPARVAQARKVLLQIAMLNKNEG